LGIGDWAQSPIPNPHNFFKNDDKKLYNNKIFILLIRL